MLCWKCKELIEGAICVSCSTIQPPPKEKDYFSILQIEKKYFLDEKKLTLQHRILSKKLHPDRWRNNAAVERRMSVQWMALINEAQTVLFDPITRARFLATGFAQAQENAGKVSSEFLEQIFTLQMQAMEDLEASKREAQVLLEQVLSSLHQIFEKWEQGEGSLDQVEELLGQWKYLTNLVNKEA